MSDHYRVRVLLILSRQVETTFRENTCLSHRSARVFSRARPDVSGSDHIMYGRVGVVHVHAKAYANPLPASLIRKTSLNWPGTVPAAGLGRFSANRENRPESSGQCRHCSNRRYLTGCRPATPPAQILDCPRQGICRGGFFAPAYPRRGLLPLTQPRERVETLPSRPRLARLNAG